MVQKPQTSGTDLPSPESVRGSIPLDGATADFVAESRAAIRGILQGTDPRLLVIAGPCSVHDYESALEYARFIREQRKIHEKNLYIVMRCYVEKSRTGLGWKGMARDPTFSGGTGTPEGIPLARKLIVSAASLGVAVAVEIVSPFLWPYWIDAVSWASIGARGVESQALREAAAALPCPCGFKNGQDGSPDSALFALASARDPSAVLVYGDSGLLQEIQAPGNPLPHIVLRGGASGPNWKLAPALAERMLKQGLVPAIIIDASHANSGKNPANQAKVAQGVCRLRAKNVPVRGIMLESFLQDGSQPLVPGSLPQSGISITDPCLGLEATRRLLGYLSANAS